MRIHRFLLICFANIRRMARVLQRRAVGTAAQRALICTCRGLATLWARAARVRAEISGVWRGFRAARAPRESRRGLGCESRCALLQRTAAQCITLQHTATGCNTLQHTATHCNTLQHPATHCNTHAAQKLKRTWLHKHVYIPKSWCAARFEI